MPSVAGVSGGRTSAFMALEFVPEDTVLCFQNTGREHPKTLEFLLRVEEDLGRPIVRLEYRAPPRGEPPGKNATVEVVDHAHLSRKGEPFIDYLEAAASYRKKHATTAKGQVPIAPWARQRVCTAYLKIKTQRKYLLGLGWKEWTSYVGLRADEPDRVARMRERNNTLDTDERAPLSDAGIVKADVLRYFAGKKYDLEIPEYLGNCTGCFLKDEADLATALLDPETDSEWWIGIEEKYAPMRRGRTSYAEVLAEAPKRMEIREAVRLGHEVVASKGTRRLTILKQEEKRFREGASGFSCSCETAERLDDADLLVTL